MAITETFTTPPTPPSSTDKTNFRTRYDAFFAYIQTLGTKLINFTTQLNSTETNINAKEASAVAAQVAAAASANFQGTWTNQTTVVGQSWLYGGIIYRVVIAGNQSPVAAPANWQAISPTFGQITETFSTTAGTWYRIAQSSLNINRCDGIFAISLSGPTHCKVRLSASVIYGANPCLSQIGYSKLGTGGITKARIVYHTTYSGNYAYLEVYVSNASTNQIFSVEATDAESWSLLPPSTVGSIPAGYSSLEYTLKSTITAGTYKSVTVDTDGCVTGGTNPTTLSGYGITDGMMASAMSGANVSLAANGYQILPSGLIIQFGTTALITGDSGVDVVFPIAFPISCLAIAGNHIGSGVDAAPDNPIHFRNLSLGSVRISNSAAAYNLAAKWIAIGY